MNRIFARSLGLSVVSGCLYAQQQQQSALCARSGVAVIGPPPNQADNGVRGRIEFRQSSATSPVHVIVDLSGVKPGKHGFHVHQLGDLTAGCASAKGHFNPDNKEHGGRDDKERHAGDLGNIVANADGIVKSEFDDAGISLTGKFDVIGRTVIIHADEDDCGKGGFPDSKTTGHAGARIACGVIGILEE